MFYAPLIQGCGVYGSGFQCVACDTMQYSSDYGGYACNGELVILNSRCSYSTISFRNRSNKQLGGYVYYDSRCCSPGCYYSGGRVMAHINRNGCCRMFFSDGSSGYCTYVGRPFDGQRHHYVWTGCSVYVDGSYTGTVRYGSPSNYQNYIHIVAYTVAGDSDCSYHTSDFIAEKGFWDSTKVQECYNAWAPRYQ